MKCVVPGCQKTIVSGRFHYFPVNNAHLCRTWLQSVRNPEYCEETELKVISQDRLMVCSEHFLPADYEGTCLKGDAVPSVFPWSPVQEQSEKQGESPTTEEDPNQQGVTEVTEKSIALKSTEVLVNKQRLLELFRSCTVCLIECCVDIDVHEKLFAVIQDCQSCGHHRVWRSQPNPDDQPQDLSKSNNEKQDVKVEDAVEAGVKKCKQELPEKGELPTNEDEPNQRGVVITQAAEISSVQKSTEVLVNKRCLLELFRSCTVCLVECCVDLEDHEKLFSVTQDCQSCGHHRVWWSQPNSADQPQDQKKSSDENHDHAAPYIKVKVGVKRRKQVVARTGSANQKGGKKSGKKMLVDVGGLCSSHADKKSSIQEEQKIKKRRKRKMKKQDGSEVLEPHLDEEASDTSMNEDLLKALKEDGELKLVIWCTECKSDASHSCFLHQHKNIVFCCAQCGDANDTENKTFEKLVVRFEDLGSFQTHAEKEHGAKAIHKLCQECSKFVVADPESRGMTEHKCEPKPKPVACPECGKKFRTKVGLKRHYSKLHEVQEHPCKYCLMIFKKRLLKLEHEQSHPQEAQPYSCPECPEKFDNIHKRNGHLKSHGGWQKHPCDTCKKSFKDLANLEKHKVIHFGEQPLQCQVVARTGSANQKGGKKSGKKMLVDVGGLCSSSADKSFIQKMQEMKKRRKLMMKRQDGSEGLEPCLDEDLLKALKEDGELKLVIWCTECLCDASHSCFLHRHKNIMFCCARCGDANDFENKDFEKLVRFEDLASFQTHVEKEHGAKAIHKLCQECGKFVVADPESRGMTEHKCQPKNKPLACPECGKKFSTKMGLKRHYSIIHEIQEHPCKYCLMIFKKRLLKLEHEQSHPQEEQPYSCPECPEKFDNIHKRNGHLKSHRDRQKHPCDTCKKSFKNIINLEKHKVIHFGEQPLQCQNAGVEPRRTKGKEMSMELKQTIVDLRSQQKSIRVIAKMLDLSRSAVAYIVNKQLRTGHVTNKRRSGRPKKTTPEDDQMIMSLMTKNPLTTIRQIRNELMVIGRDVSATTIRRKLHTLNPSECHTATKSDVENLSTDGLKLQLVTNKTVLVGQKMLTEKFLD